MSKDSYPTNKPKGPSPGGPAVEGGHTPGGPEVEHGHKLLGGMTEFMNKGAGVTPGGSSSIQSELTKRLMPLSAVSPALSLQCYQLS